MKMVVSPVVAALLLVACTGSTTESSGREAPPIPVTADELEACGVDEGERDRFLSLSSNAFDQDLDGGWRAVAEIEGCELAAATLLDAFISQHGIEPGDGVMHWHVGQLLALAGERETAIPWMTSTARGDTAWALYVWGTVAFLARDRPGLEKNTELLAASPVSEEEKAMRRQFLQENPDIVVPDGFVDEPQNLGVLQGLIACFDEPYSVAYGCRP